MTLDLISFTCDGDGNDGLQCPDLIQSGSTCRATIDGIRGATKRQLVRTIVDSSCKTFWRRQSGRCTFDYKNK